MSNIYTEGNTTVIEFTEEDRRQQQLDHDAGICGAMCPHCYHQACLESDPEYRKLFPGS